MRLPLAQQFRSQDYNIRNVYLPCLSTFQSTAQPPFYTSGKSSLMLVLEHT